MKSQLNPPQHNNAANHEVNNIQQYEQQQSSKCEELLMCFRFTLNYETVISLENSNRNSTFLSVMAGMRTIVCLWISVFHVYYYSLFAISNTPFIFAKLEKLTLQPVLQACFYVDVFFIMRSVRIIIELKMKDWRHVNFIGILILIAVLFCWLIIFFLMSHKFKKFVKLRGGGF